MKIYLVRHGETTLNARECYYGRTDVCLSGRGRRQAEELRNFFGQIPLDAVVTSPLKRAVETAEIILSGRGIAGALEQTEPAGRGIAGVSEQTEPADRGIAGVSEQTELAGRESAGVANPAGEDSGRGTMAEGAGRDSTTEAIKIYRDERLCEQDFGIFEGLTYRELTKRYPEQLDAWNRDYFGYRIPEGESFLDVRRREELFFGDLKERAATAGRESALLLVAHKGTLGHFLAVSLGLPPEGYWNFVFEQGCYSRIDLEDGYAIIRKLNQSAREQ